MPEAPSSKKLGQILIEQGVLTTDNLDKALELQKRESGLLGEILIRLRMVKEEDVVVALATQFHYPYLAVENFTVNPEAINVVPVQMAKKYTFMPIDKVNTILTAVMADPSDETAIHEIEAATRCKLQAFVGTVSEIEQAIRVNYKVSLDEKAKTDMEKVKMIFRTSAGNQLKKEN